MTLQQSKIEQHIERVEADISYFLDGSRCTKCKCYFSEDDINYNNYAIDDIDIAGGDEIDSCDEVFCTFVHNHCESRV